MTEVMVHSVLEGGFSFNGSKFNHIQSSNNEGEVSNAQKEEVKESIEKQKMECDGNSEGAVSKIDTHRNTENSTLTSKSNESQQAISTTDANDNLVPRENSEPNEESKSLETETTVTNTTSNSATKSTTGEIMDVTTDLEQSTKSGFSDEITEDGDKSRVIVQVLKSDKSQNVIQSKSSNSEGQSTPSFRDDLCKLLSKSHTSKFHDAHLQGNNLSNQQSMHNIHKDRSLENQDPGSYIAKAHHKKKLHSYFLNGRGLKIRDLKCVCDNMRLASPASLRYLHYLMFSSFRLCGSGVQLLKTKKNIGGFCGYPFKRSSEEFDKKKKCLSRLSDQMLTGIYQAIFGKTEFLNRCVMIDQLLDFLWMPRECSDILKKYECEKLNLTEEEYAALKESALKGSAAIVTLEKLSENDIKKHISDNAVIDKASEECLSSSSTDEGEQPSFSMDESEQPSSNINESEPPSCSWSKSEQPSCNKSESEQPTFSKSESELMEEDSCHTIPAFILNGPGKKLKCFSRIAFNVKQASEKAVKTLHYILYGRIEPSVKDCRRNILEFNGFSDCQQEFAAERRDIINGLDKSELFELCKILCLRGQTNSREVRIKKIFEYLQSPTKPVLRKCIEPFQWQMQTPVSPRVCRVETSSLKLSPYKTYKVSQYPMTFSPGMNRLESSMPRRSYRGVIRRRGRGRGRGRRSFSLFRPFNSGFERPQPPSIIYPPSSEDCLEEVFKSDGWKLRDFKTICSNIECAAPCDLIELNDLLFLKTCDESDIHQKILDFQGFKFPLNSFHYDSRKTLMHYMGFCVVRKIARLLDIENWETITNPEDLSSNVLKFLMDRKDLSTVKYLTSTPRPVLEGNYSVESATLLPPQSASESCGFIKPSAPLSPNSFLESNCTTEPSPSSSKYLFESTVDKEPSSFMGCSFEREPLPPSSFSESLPGSSCLKEPSASSEASSSKFLFQSNTVNEPTPSSSSSSSTDKSSFKSGVCKGPSIPQSSYPLSESHCEVQSTPSSAMVKYNPPMPKSITSQFFQQTNQAYTHHKGKVIIQRLTKASVQTQEMCQSGVTNDKSVEMHMEESFKPSLQCVNSAEDDSIRLRDLIHHPTEQELKDLIYQLVKENLWSFTMGDLVQKVYECYPKWNLMYRESFIKFTARQMLAELRDYAVSAVKDNVF